MLRLLLIRHGETDWNASGRYQGQMDIPLNEAGVEQARILGRRLRNEPSGPIEPVRPPGSINALYASDLARAWQTAQTVGEACGLAPQPEPRLRELSLCRSLDARGRPISAYLWQMLEGRRPPDDYLALVRTARARCPGGLLQIALHPWHLTVSAEGVATGDAPVRRLHEFLDRLVALPGVAFTTAGAYLEANS